MNAHAAVEPRRFLFAMWEGGGNVPPQLELARWLVQRGHHVTVMSEQCNEPEVRAAGCDFVAYTRAPNRPDKSAASTFVRDYEAKSPIQGFTIFRDTVMVNPARAYAADVPSPVAVNGSDPLVVVSFSTTFQNQYAVVQNVIDAVGELPLRGIVTMGPSLDEAGLRVSPNVTLQRVARHSKLFKQAAAVVTHGGHGTVIRALAAGVPVVCIPMGRDQEGNGARVVARNAGKMLSVKAPVAAIRAAINEVVTVPRYREQARQLGHLMVCDAQSSCAVEEMEGIAARATGNGRRMRWLEEE